jgi:hypothetical protein
MTGEHYGQQIEGLAKYRDVTQPGLSYIYSHCLVTLHYGHELTQAERRRSGQKQRWVEYWLDYRLYRRKAELEECDRQAEFRTKPQLLIAMLRAQDWSRLPIHTIVFDHLYLTPDVVQAVTDLDLHWVSKAGKNDYAWWRGQWMRLDEILKRLPARKFKAVWVQTSNGRLKTIQRFWLLNLLAYAVLALARFATHPLAEELVPDVRTLGQARQFLDVTALLALVSLVITLAQVHSAEDIARLLVKGLDSANLALTLQEQPP